MTWQILVAVLLMGLSMKLIKRHTQSDMTDTGGSILLAGLSMKLIK